MTYKAGINHAIDATAISDKTDEKTSGNRRDPNNPHMIVLPSGKKVPANGKKFQPGRSGNVRGRPKRDLDLAAEARRHAHKAINALVQIVEDEEQPSPARISAANSLLDRGFGSAPKAIDVNVSHSFSQELSAFLRRLHQQETGQVVENEGNAGLIEAVDATDVEFDEIDEER
jgi:hypothetical protein